MIDFGCVWVLVVVVNFVDNEKVCLIEYSKCFVDLINECFSDFEMFLVSLCVIVEKIGDLKMFKWLDVVE